jgi:Ca2+-binding RTX toxin-like protein
MTRKNRRNRPFTTLIPAAVASNPPTLTTLIPAAVASNPPTLRSRPTKSTGGAANIQDSDYLIVDDQSGIQIFNDSRNDGDSLIFLELGPDANGRFARDFYTFRENRNVNAPVQEWSGDSASFDPNIHTYVAPIETTPDLTSGFQFTVVLIQDNESETGCNPIRRTPDTRPGAPIPTFPVVDEGNNVVEFLADNRNDTILARGGNDVVRSGGGDDIVFGEAGNDSIDGGGGNDYLFGNQGNDTILGGEGNDWLDGGTGNDQMNGGTGNDTFVVDSSGDRILDAPGTGIETVLSSVNWQLQEGLEHLGLLGNAVSGIGNGLNNYIRGNDFANRLEGRGGDDTLLGEDPGIYARYFANQDIGAYPRLISYEEVSLYLNRIIAVQNRSPESPDEPVLLPGQGNDTIFGGAGNDVILGMFGDDILYGEAGNDRLYGGLGNDTLYGGLGSDRLDGGEGANLLEGGSGDDIYVIRNVLDRIVDSPGTGIETVESYITFDLEQYSMAAGAPRVGTTGLDNLTLVYDDLTLSGGLNGYGNSLSNVLIGNQANNILNGRGGNDTLVATGGVDTLIGGAGADRFRFTQSAPSVSYSTTIQDFSAAEGDVIEIARGGFGGNPTLSQFRFTPLSATTGNLSFNGAGGTQLLATIQSNVPFNLNSSLRFI